MGEGVKNDHTGGIFIERKLYLSDAFLALSKNARMVLLAFLDCRQTNPAFKKAVKGGFRADRYVDLDKIKMPYVKLNQRYGVPVQSVSRALDELLAKGFIEIKHTGGAGEHDQSIYGLVDDYLRWSDGITFRQRKKDVRRGFQGKGLGALLPNCNQVSHAKSESYTHAKQEPSHTQNRSL
jgi:hypothetical protein